MTEEMTDDRLARRMVMKTGLSVGFALAAGQVSAAVIHTDTVGLVAGEIAIDSDGAMLPAYFARPEGPGPFATVQVLEEIFGVHEHIKDVCRRLAKRGYLAIAVEYYARLGNPAAIADPAVIQRDIIAKAPDAQILADLEAAATWAFAHGGDPHRLGVIGFCQGGRNAWLYAEQSARLRAAVAFYGTVNLEPNAIKRSTVNDAVTLHCPLLSLSGDADTAARPELLRQAAERARQAGKTVELVIYPGAGHAFFADYRPSYIEKDARDAWDRALAWLTRYGVA